MTRARTSMLALVCILVALASAQTAGASAARPWWANMTLRQVIDKQRSIIRHDRQIISGWRESRWLPLTRYVSQLRPGPYVPPPGVVFAQKQLRWTTGQLRRNFAALKRQQSAGGPSLRDAIYRLDSCLATIIDREDPSWSPLQYNTKGSGAYGLPQALPGSKMASAGPDWKTNPWTQIRWMQRYVGGYGGSCAALAFWNAHGWY